MTWRNSGSAWTEIFWVMIESPESANRAGRSGDWPRKALTMKRISIADLACLIPHPHTCAPDLIMIADGWPLENGSAPRPAPLNATNYLTCRLFLRHTDGVPPAGCPTAPLLPRR